jgi:Fe-S-cluster containining protein
VRYEQAISTLIKLVECRALLVTAVVSFRCRLDGSCCKKYWIPVIHLDLWRLYYYGGVADLEDYVTLVEGKEAEGTPKPLLFNGEYVYLALAWRDDACIFLASDGRCTVHPFKPLVCRFYPFVYHVREDGEVEIDVNEGAIGECPGLIMDDKPIDPEIVEYLKRLARARILELKLWDAFVEEWNERYGRSSSLSKLIELALERARRDFKELVSKNLWVK